MLSHEITSHINKALEDMGVLNSGSTGRILCKAVSAIDIYTTNLEDRIHRLEQIHKDNPSSYPIVDDQVYFDSVTIGNYNNVPPHLSSAMEELVERRFEAQQYAHTISQLQFSLKAQDSEHANLEKRHEAAQVEIQRQATLINQLYTEKDLLHKSVQDSLKEAQDKHAALTKANEKLNSMAAQLECSRGAMLTLEQIHNKTVVELATIKELNETNSSIARAQAFKAKDLEMEVARLTEELEGYKNSKPQADLAPVVEEVNRVAKSVDEGIARVDALLKEYPLPAGIGMNAVEKFVAEYPTLPTPASSSRADEDDIPF